MTDRSWGGRYELALGVALALAFLYGPARSTTAGLLTAVEQRGFPPLGVLAAVCCFAVAIWVAGWHFAGPLAISSERLQWMVWRRDPVAWLSRDRFRTLLVGALLAGIVASLAALALGGVVGSPAILFGLVFWAALQSLAMFVGWLQQLDLDAVARVVPAGFGLAGVGFSALLAWGVVVSAVVLGGLLGLLVASHPSTVRSVFRPRRGAPGAHALTPRWQLHRGARNRWSVRAGVTMLDAEIVRVVGERDTGASARPLPASLFRGGRAIGLFLVTFVRTVRPAMVAVAFTMPFALAVHEFLGPAAAVSVLVLLEFVVTVLMSGSVRAWLAQPAFRRTWAAAGLRFPIALAGPGLAVCAGIALTATAGMGLPPAVSAVLVVLPAAVFVRQSRASRPTDQLTLLSTPAGAIPLQTMNRAIAGPDVVLTALLLVAALL